MTRVYEPSRAAIRAARVMVRKMIQSEATDLRWDLPAEVMIGRVGRFAQACDTSPGTRKAQRTLQLLHHPAQNEKVDDDVTSSVTLRDSRTATHLTDRSPNRVDC